MWYLDQKPYEVQTKALEMADGHRGFAYFMEMGLGKTAVVLAEYTKLIIQDKVDTLIVICPNSLKKVWKKEVEKWGVDLPVVLWPKKLDPKDRNTILTINYEAVRGKGGDYLLSILKERRCYVALDESIHVKNPQSQRTKALIDLCKRAIVVRALSGAPIVKSALDIWGQLRVLGHLSGYNPFAFRNHFCVMGGYMGKQIVGTRNEEELSDLLDQHSFRAQKADWTDLPAQLYSNFHYELPPDQAAVYRGMLDEFVVQIHDEVITAPMAITQMMKLQQISSGFIIDEEGKTHLPWKKNKKIDLLTEIVENTPGKVIIFCFYKQSIRNLLEQFPNAAVIRGKGNEDIEDEKLRFNEGDADVMVAQLTAGKYGHTLLGDQDNNPCHTAIFFENNYDLDTRIQAEARNHRHGQRHVVTYIDLIGPRLDQVIIDALQRKLNIGRSVINYIKKEC